MFEMYKTSIDAFGFIGGTWFYIRSYLIGLNLYLWWARVTKKKWCRQNGYSCKDKKCEYEHLDKPIDVCCAILKFRETDRFVMCEREKNHKGNHEAIGWIWEQGVEDCHAEYLFMHYNLMQNHLNKKFGKVKK